MYKALRWTLSFIVSEYISCVSGGTASGPLSRVYWRSHAYLSQRSNITAHSGRLDEWQNYGVPTDLQISGFR